MPLLLALFLVVLAPTLQPAPDAQGYAKLSPFEAVEWDGATPEVRVRSRWYELAALDGVGADEIVSFCQRRFGARWRKRFEEDLVEVLSRMGHEPGRFVSLEVVDREGARRTLERVEMTEANRNAIWAAANGGPGRPTAPVVLTAAEVLQDLDHLGRLIDERFAYRDRTRYDWAAALDELRDRARDGTTAGELALELTRLLAGFGDGHTRVRGFELPPGYVATLPVRLGDRLYAFRADRSALLDPEHPVLAAIDGVPIERWLEAAGRYAARGSAAFHRRHATRNLRHVAFLREELGLPAAREATLTLATRNGARTRELSLPILGDKPTYGEWPRGGHRLLEGNVGYLRLASMEDEPDFLRGLADAMERFRGTTGLIVDVRGNGGGSRDALRLLFPYLLDEDEPGHVANVARFRRQPDQPPDDPAGYLADRYLHPLASERWSAAERRLIEGFARGFRAAWPVSDLEFSDPHYLVLTRAANPDAYRYEAPVVVLQDDGCFSATDVFLGALAGRPGITRMGTTSGGGSGRSVGHRLAASGLTVQLSSMASYRPDGRTYDGVGVEPDVVVQPLATDFTGETDTVLDAALARLR